MTQLSFLPIRLVDEFEADRSKSKDLLWTGIDEQDRRYALKTSEPNDPLLPITEWTCYHLCLLCGIPTPDFAVITRPNGSTAFGSRWENDVDQFVRDETAPATLIRWLAETIDDVSAMYMLDCFLPNSDRHIGNILFRRTARRRALAFDWSRTFLFNPWPLDPLSATLQNIEWLKRQGLYSTGAGNRVLEKLADITETDFSNILHGAPNEWATEASKSLLINWWKVERIARIEKLR